MSRGRFCVTCREVRREPVTCAPERCYCNHRACPAFASYITVRGRHHGRHPHQTHQHRVG